MTQLVVRIMRGAAAIAAPFVARGSAGMLGMYNLSELDAPRQALAVAFCVVYTLLRQSHPYPHKNLMPRLPGGLSKGILQLHRHASIWHCASADMVLVHTTHRDVSCTYGTMSCSNIRLHAACLGGSKPTCRSGLRYKCVFSLHHGARSSSEQKLQGAEVSATPSMPARLGLVQGRSSRIGSETM